MATFEELLQSLEAPRAELAEYEAALAEQIREDVIQAVREYQEHVAAVVRSNPRRPVDEILERGDIQRTLAQVMGDLRRRSRSRIEDAWQFGSDLATNLVNEQLDATDAGFRQRINRSESAYLDGLLRDMDANIDRLTNRVVDDATAAFESVPTPESYREREGGVINVPKAQARNRADRIEQDLARAGISVAHRVRAGGVVAAERGFTETQMMAYQRLAARDPSVRKVWVANFVNNVPCAMCHALHGTELPVGAQFNPYRSFGRVSAVFMDLYGPPRHPNCKCKLVIIGDSIEQTDVSVAGMRRYAERNR